MKLKDLDEAFALWEKVNILEFPRKKEQAYVERMIALNPSSCLVGIENNQIIATILGVFNGRRAWIYHFAVDPSYQKEGYGTKILNECENTLKNIGADVALIWVIKTNTQVVPFYQQRNYKEYNDAIPMRKEL